MNRKYTREQIEEAISYWTGQLRLMKESAAGVVDALIAEFGEDTVKSSDFSFVVTKDGIQKIYDILNFHLFGNELGRIRLEYWPEALTVGKMNENALKSGVYDKKYTEAPGYGVCSAVCGDVKDDGGNIIDVSISEDIIMLNKAYLVDCIFIFAVASVCHEMIHYYDRFSGEYHDRILEQSRNDVFFDAHKDQIFQEMMKKAAGKGIDVKETLEDTPFRIANLNARRVLKNVIGEDESVQSHIVVDRRRITMRGPGSHTFMFAEFD